MSFSFDETQALVLSSNKNNEIEILLNAGKEEVRRWATEKGKAKDD